MLFNFSDEEQWLSGESVWYLNQQDMGSKPHKSFSVVPFGKAYILDYNAMYRTQIHRSSSNCLFQGIFFLSHETQKIDNKFMSKWVHSPQTLQDLQNLSNIYMILHSQIRSIQMKRNIRNIHKMTPSHIFNPYCTGGGGGLGGPPPPRHFRRLRRNRLEF